MQSLLTAKRIRRRVIPFYMLCVMAILIISFSLTDMELKVGTPFPGDIWLEEGNGQVLALEPIKAIQAPLWMQGVCGLASLIVLILLVIKLLKRRESEVGFPSGDIDTCSIHHRVYLFLHRLISVCPRIRRIWDSLERPAVPCHLVYDRSGTTPTYCRSCPKRHTD